MSATLRYEIGVAAYQYMRHFVEPEFQAFGAKEVRVWQGIRRGNVVMIGFSVSLPDHVVQAWRTLIRLEYYGPFGSPAVVRTGLHVFKSKLTASMGLPTGDIVPGEVTFLKQIHKSPDDATTWRVYADWVEEVLGDPVRAGLIRGWTAPKPAMKVKYGVTVDSGDRYRGVPTGERLVPLVMPGVVFEHPCPPFV